MESLAETLVLQPEYMWIAQLEQSADVAAQAAAIAGLTTFRWVMVPSCLSRDLLIACLTMHHGRILRQHATPQCHGPQA